MKEVALSQPNLPCTFAAIPRTFVVIMVSIALTGCMHRHPLAVPPIPPPVLIDLAMTDTGGPLELDSEDLDSIPLPSMTPHPPRKPRPKPLPVEAAPNEVASVAPPPAPPVDETLIGSLTSGGSDSSDRQHKAFDAITALEKSLAAVPQAKVRTQRGGVAQVQNFVRRAKGALKSGDSDGALTLATKARVLLDDLMK